MSHWSSGFQITPHPLAPRLSLSKDAGLVISQLVTDITSGHLPLGCEESRLLLAEAGLVSLWFYLKFIAGYNGPFDKLNTGLHRDMCNFRQSSLCMAPGAHAGICMPRKHYKSTVFTEGGTSWELNRSGDLCFRITNAVVDRAEEFMHTAQRIFDSNEFFAWIYPDHTMKRGMERWNDKEAVVRWRTRHYTEPSIKCGGATGASSGDHHDVLCHDDLIDMTMLDSLHKSGVDIMKARDFLKTSEKTLVRSWSESRIIVPHTRYAVDDCYEPIWADAKQIIGHHDYRFHTKEDGAWTIYYRAVEEDGEIIFPEAITRDGLAKMARDDWWTYATQYMNNPYDAGGSELVSLPHTTFNLIREQGEWILSVSETDKVPLSRCDVVVACDPAATEREVSAKTSRSAVVAWARDPRGRSFLFAGQAGYVEIFKVFDWIFEIVAKYEGIVRQVIFERVAFQRILQPLLEAERRRRNLFVTIYGKSAIGDKTARIRSAFAPELQAGRIFIEAGLDRMFLEEKNTFPTSRLKDVLDASEMALSSMSTPFSEEEEADIERNNEERMYAYGRNATTGY